MYFDLYDYRDDKGNNIIKAWTNGLQKVQRGKLNARLDMLEKSGPDLFPQILTGTKSPGISKLRVKGNVQLRPMLCDGPINIGKEYTLLLGAIEKDSKLIPKNADKKADSNKKDIMKDDNRRTTHERIS